jgi:hypothetical protein
MNELLRLDFSVIQVEKRTLERLTEVNGEPLASSLRRLIRQAASAHGLGKPGLSYSNVLIGESNE